MRIFKKRKDLQPWLDYFKLLQTYKEKGYLEVNPFEGNAYVTRAALHAMSEGDDPSRQMLAISATVRRIRAYAAWLSQQGPSYLRKTFAVHVVKEEMPHDLIYTVVMESRRPWWKFFMWHDHIEVVLYQKED